MLEKGQYLEAEMTVTNRNNKTEIIGVELNSLGFKYQILVILAI